MSETQFKGRIPQLNVKVL